MLAHSPLKSLVYFLQDIKLQHTFFALPFATSALFLMPETSVSFYQILLLLGCMIAARSFAMGVNRYLDRDIDAQNPRTSQRLLPQGVLKPKDSLIWIFFFAASFMLLSFSLSQLAGFLSLFVLLVLGFYSYLKRFTWLCHLYLGFCLSLSPVAVEIALRGQMSLQVFVISLGVMFWTAGFDILYALQDLKFDRSHQLKSIPSLFGVNKSLNLSRLFSAFCFLSFTGLGFLNGYGMLYFLTMGIIALTMIWQQREILEFLKTNSKSSLMNAFFYTNVFISFLFLFVIIAENIGRLS